MANNLFISYDLNSPGQDYTKVHDAIKSLGEWAQAQDSMWYVNSTHSTKSAADIVWKHMDPNDSLIVIDSSNGSAYWYNLPVLTSKFLENQWNK